MKKILLTTSLILLTIFTFAQGPVASYSFTGNGQDNVGVFDIKFNNATLTTDRFGNANSAYLFNGSQKMETAVTSLTNIFTISVWAKLSQAEQLASIVSVGESKVDDAYSVELRSNINASPGKEIFCGGSINASSLKNITSNKWHHIVITFDGTTINFYNDDTLISSAPKSNVTINSYLVTIGNSKNDDRGFKGAIDDVKLYNRAITSTEVTELFNEGVVEVSTEVIETSEQGESATINIVTDTTWTATSSETWATLSIVNTNVRTSGGDNTIEGKKNSTISIQTEANTGLTERTATITIKNTGGATKKINLTQAAAEMVTGITEATNSNSNFNVYPNPTKGDLNINISDNTGDIQIYDLSGKLVKTFQIDGINKYDVSGFQEGIYVIMINNDSSKTQKLVIQ